jgi:L-fuconolactonase
VRIVDTHCHSSPYWYEPVESLIHQMDQNEVEHVVLVQHQGQFDNSYFFECHSRFPGRFALIVLVDSSRPSAPQEVAELARRGAKGLRVSAETRSAGDDPLAIWRAAAQNGLSVSCNSGPESYASPDFIALVEALPNLPIVVEHLGGLSAARGPLPSQSLQQGVFNLARYSNVYLRFHGLGEISRRNSPVTTPFPFDRTGVELLHAAYDAFGPERMMWGSDFPPVSGREGYANALRLPLAELADKPEAARAACFGGTAAKLYGFA